jgi:hypothetical protein
MLDAYHKTTSTGFYASQVWTSFPDPYSEEWVCCPLEDKKVTPVIGHKRQINGKEVSVVSFFRLAENVGNCSFGESDEHKNEKILVATLIENNNVPLIVGETPIPYSSLKIKNVSGPQFRWEQTRENRRADVLFEFQEWHNVLGQGIVFEVQLSRITDIEREQREEDWISRGYSITWFSSEDFEENSLTDNKIRITSPWFLKYLQTQSEMLSETKIVHAEMKEIIDLYIEEQRKEPRCKNCKFGKPDKLNEEVIVCWFDTKWRNGINTHPTKSLPTYHCIHWEK